MIERRLLGELCSDLNEVPAVVLVGPRQVGKTTLARAVSAILGGTYLDLQRPADVARLSDPDAYLRSRTGLCVIDEIQRVPDLFPTLRGIIDDRRARGDRAGHFLLLGSASLDLLQHSGETLAGRIRVRELSGIELGEVQHQGTAGVHVDTEDSLALWIRGGFPESLLAPSDAASRRWREDLIESYLVREVPIFSPRLPATTIGRLWRMLGHEQGQLLNQSRLGAALGVSATSVARYVDLLQDLRLVRLLPAWSGNLRKRLVRSPKTYVRDSGLVHALLGLTSLDDVLGHVVCGASYEGWIIEQVLARFEAGPGGVTPTFFRTQAGAEADLVLERGGHVHAVIEIKRSTSPRVGRGLHAACADLQPTKAYVVYPGMERFSLGDGIEAISLGELLTELAQDLNLT